MNIDGLSASSTFSDGVNTDKINDLTESSSIELTDNLIDFVSSNVFVNGVPISTTATALSNPLISVLNCGGNNLVNMGSLAIDFTDFVNETETALSDIPPLQTKTQNITATSGQTVMSGSLLCSSVTLATGAGIGVLGGNYVSTNNVAFDQDVIFNGTASPSFNGLNAGWVSNFLPKTALAGNIGTAALPFVDSHFSGSVNAASYNESSIPGELLKVKNSTTYYAGAGAGSALTTSTGSVLIGSNAGASITTQRFNTAFGQEALQYFKGEYNTAYGALAHKGVLGQTNTGEFNVAMGWCALCKIDTGSENVAVGHSAGLNMITGSMNTVIGARTNSSFNNTNTTNCVVVGAGSNSNGGINRGLFGVNIGATKDNQITLGNAAVTEIINAGNNTCDLGSTTNQFKELYINQINGLTPSGGVYMTTSNSTAITATVAEISLLLGATFDGSLSVAANTFQIASYHLNLSGQFSSANGDTLTLKIKTNATILSTFVINLTGTVGEFYELEGDFSIRKLGAAGVAEISGNFDFSYSDTVVFLRGSRECVVNTTIFDTTISNSLDATAQFSSNNASNRIQTLQAILTRIY
jgi:hypothetical protein